MPTSPNTSNMNEQLPYLETFARAAELSSFSAAAQSLGISQSAVSQRIQALEQVLQGTLFDRQGRHVILTDAGHSLYSYSQRILTLHREAIHAVTGREMPVLGDLELAASSVPGEHFLPSLLARFKNTHPHIKVRARVGDTKSVLDQVERGAVHLGLVGDRRNGDNLEFRTFAQDTLVLAVP